jgi:potassium-transporting ATPase A subunit
MNPSLAGILQLAALVAALAVCYKPLGDYIARVFMSPKHLRVEAGFYRVMGIDAEADQRWGAYARSMLAFSGVCVLFLYLLERIQHWLPYSNGQANVSPFLAWNTAASFVTNTNWQNYSGETTMGYVVQMAGDPGPAADLGDRRHRPDGCRRDRQLQRHARDLHADRPPAEHGRRAGGLAGSHQELGNNGRTNYLRFHMTQLRRMLEENPSRPRHLLTEPGMGYRYQP